MGSFTDDFLAYFLLEECKLTNFEPRVYESIEWALALHPKGGYIESERIAEVWYAQKLKRNSWDNSLSYVQFVLREAPHVCRNGERVGKYFVYRAHVEVECSARCKAKGSHGVHVERPAEYCSHCFLQLPATGVCGNCS
jgi:hypothetical protein